MSPSGQVDILSTHDQLLGGPHGQTYFGCHFPADPEYAARLAAEGLKVGRRLAREGVIGRAAVDFVAVRDGGLWRIDAVEINLRCGGTTPFVLALQALTDGAYEPPLGRVPDATRWPPQVLRGDRPPRFPATRSLRPTTSSMSSASAGSDGIETARPGWLST